MAPKILRYFRVEPSNNRTGWVETVARGDWAAIPTDLGFEESGELAMLLDGYRVAKALRGKRDGIAAAADVARAQRDDFDRSGKWRGSAIELWVTLFFKHRSDRFTTSSAIVMHPDGTRTVIEPATPEPMWDELIKALRTALMEHQHWPAT